MAIKFDPRELDEQYNLDKESIARNWFFVGVELKRIKRSYPSTKLFGQYIAKTDFAVIANHDRSVAIWMFENWRDVFDWLEAATGSRPSDPFAQLAALNASHPAHIKRRVTAWKEGKQRRELTV
jgi:hypothetical protein